MDISIKKHGSGGFSARLEEKLTDKARKKKKKKKVLKVRDAEGKMI